MGRSHEGEGEHSIRAERRVFGQKVSKTDCLSYAIIIMRTLLVGAGAVSWS
jgi:hypothetical protein